MITNTVITVNLFRGRAFVIMEPLSDGFDEVGYMQR